MTVVYVDGKENADHIQINPNLVKESLDKFVYKGENIQKFLLCSAILSKELSDAGVFTAKLRTLQNAQGVYLDEIGEQIGVKRDGRSDKEYRLLLMTLCYSSAGGATMDDFCEIYARLSNTDPSTVDFSIDFNNKVNIIVYKNCFQADKWKEYFNRILPINCKVRLAFKESPTMLFLDDINQEPKNQFYSLGERTSDDNIKLNSVKSRALEGFYEDKDDGDNPVQLNSSLGDTPPDLPQWAMKDINMPSGLPNKVPVTQKRKDYGIFGGDALYANEFNQLFYEMCAYLAYWDKNNPHISLTDDYNVTATQTAATPVCVKNTFKYLTSTAASLTSSGVGRLLLPSTTTGTPVSGQKWLLNHTQGVDGSTTSDFYDLYTNIGGVPASYITAVNVNNSSSITSKKIFSSTASMKSLGLTPNLLINNYNIGIYYCDVDADAVLTDGYPVNASGCLEVLPSSYGIMQRYTTYNNQGIYVRNKNQDGSMGAWNNNSSSGNETVLWTGTSTTAVSVTVPKNSGTIFIKISGSFNYNIWKSFPVFPSVTGDFCGDEQGGGDNEDRDGTIGVTITRNNLSFSLQPNATTESAARTTTLLEVFWRS